MSVGLAEDSRRILDRVPVDQISDRAREVKFSRTVLTLLAGLIFGTFWLLSKAAAVAWLGLAWCVTAARLGWHEARGNQPSRASLREENKRLREALARYGG